MNRLRRGVFLAATAFALLAGSGHVAQAQAVVSRNNLQSPILTVDSERFYASSAYGQRVLAEARQAEQALSLENEAVREALEDEEREITDQRATLSAEEFRELADAFDAKVQEAYRAHNTKVRDLNQRIDRYQLAFQQAAAPVLEKIMRDAGAAVILERRTVYVSANAIDITELAIERINAVLSDQLP
ncbi:MAG: OmpH family outer membrane protein [Rhodobacteraceae bacterium]|nr:OmpH family outer membrane protein [Paracoccaceae bacterium]